VFQITEALDVHGSVHYSTNHIEITNKMQPSTRIYYSSVLLIAQRVFSDTLLIIGSSKTVLAASGFTCICGCRQLSSRSGQVQKISPPPGFDPWTAQPVASRYTDCATRPTLLRCTAIYLVYCYMFQQKSTILMESTQQYLKLTKV
jgi:hypothetical protein